MTSVHPVRNASPRLVAWAGAALCLGFGQPWHADAQAKGHAATHAAPPRSARPQNFSGQRQQPIQGQLHQNPTNPAQQHQSEPYQPQPFRTQPYQGQPYQGQANQGQPYQGQPSQGQPYQGQQRQAQPNPAPAAQSAAGRQAPGNTPLVSPGHPTPSQQHLAGWMDAHRALSPAQQHTALEAEPGFRDLKPEEQQRLHNQLTRLDKMPPQQQRMVIQRNEAMERLSVPQRQQVRAAAQQLGSLPQDRIPVVARTFRMLRDMPEEQRRAYVNSPQYRSQFNDQERSVLGNLVNIAPLLPPATAAQPPR